MCQIYRSIRGTLQKIIVICTGRLVNKLVLLFSFIVILIVISLTLVSNKIIENESVRNIIDSNVNNLKLVNKNIENYLAEIDQYSVPKLEYGQVMNAILYDSEYDSQRFLEDYIQSLFYSRNDVGGIFLYINGSKKCFYIYRPFESQGVQISYNPDIPKQQWFINVMKSNKNRYIQSLLEKEDIGYGIHPEGCFMAYHRAFIDITSRKQIAVISIFLNPSGRDKVLKDVPVDKGEHLILLDSNRFPYYMDDRKFYDSQDSKLFFDATSSKIKANYISESSKYLVIRNTSEIENWNLIKLIPYNEIYEAAQTNRNLSLIVGCIFLVASILLVTLTSNAISKPLKVLSKKMDRFSDGIFDVEAKVIGRDEIAQLSKKFNQMVKKINDLINEEYKMKLVKKIAILKALEAEINPHFLYNALQAIATKALERGASDVSDMVDALALTFRYCINGRDMVKVEDEIKHIENYLVLQNARYGRRLLVLYMLESSALEVKIPRLSIQMLVENSIKHALEQVSTMITITIKVKMDGKKTVVAVKDDGPGICPERLESILQLLDSEWESTENNSIGLKNLNTRLKLICGPESHIHIETGEDGTEVSFVIPEGD